MSRPHFSRSRSRQVQVESQARVKGVTLPHKVIPPPGQPDLPLKLTLQIPCGIHETALCGAALPSPDPPESPGGTPSHSGGPSWLPSSTEPPRT
ncbi:hypothetical protein AAFF_G00088230 [Aldrovandia affinis]|uniref:Uncharacterized protein n=1 Tax=Aldrovandia affinis TaxID=143900 RepID=A0AAD7RW35_9TELE|nr:hypothetical protein AAFF_G00088230 [Aldrovandia affinis]